MYVKLEIIRVKVIVTLMYGPAKGYNEEEKFLRDLGRFLDRVGNGYILYVIRDLNK